MTREGVMKLVVNKGMSAGPNSSATHSLHRPSTLWTFITTEENLDFMFNFSSFKILDKTLAGAPFGCLLGFRSPPFPPPLPPGFFQWFINKLLYFLGYKLSRGRGKSQSPDALTVHPPVVPTIPLLPFPLRRVCFLRIHFLASHLGCNSYLQNASLRPSECTLAK